MPHGDPYPLLLTPLLMDKVWGGDRLARFGKAVKHGAKVGESWELADMAATSSSGAGGGAARTLIANGPLAGKTLADARAAWGRGLLGVADAKTPVGTNFPMLVKYLDAREDLSVQVHPSPAYAAANKDAHLKTECWYILAAEHGAKIYKGVKPGVTRESFAAHIRDNTVVNDMIALDAVPGECHNLPSGTVHALGAGVLVAEVQTPSDTTFRVFDWGRTGRQLHIEQSLECIDWNEAPIATRLSPEKTSMRHVDSEYFTLDELRPKLGQVAHLDNDRCVALMVVAGHADLQSPAGALPLAVGTTVLVPAAIASSTRIIAGDGLTLLVATVV
ncbi:MAG: type I phosphomannose isomerase catalytic subunit [Phycisphaerales bacterium]